MQKYIVTEKSTGKELLNMEFTKADEVTPEIKKLYDQGYKITDINVMIADDEGQREVTPPKIRKPRSDAGKPHNKQEPGKKVRNRGQFFICDKITCYATRAELDKALEAEPVMPFVIQGRELKAEKKVLFTLKTVK